MVIAEAGDINERPVSDRNNEDDQRRVTRGPIFDPNAGVDRQFVTASTTDPRLTRFQLRFWLDGSSEVEHVEAFAASDPPALYGCA